MGVLGLHEPTASFVWTCDRCGKAETLYAPPEQPVGWAAVYVATPPRAEVAGVKAVICQTCRRDLDLLLERLPEAVDPASTVGPDA